ASSRKRYGIELSKARRLRSIERGEAGTVHIQHALCVEHVEYGQVVDRADYLRILLVGDVDDVYPSIGGAERLVIAHIHRRFVPDGKSGESVARKQQGAVRGGRVGDVDGE